MTENERSGKRPRTRIGEPEEFQQRRSFKFYHRDGDEEGQEERRFGDKPRGERRFDDRGDRRFGDRKFGDRPRRRFDDDDRPRRRFDDDRPRGGRRFDDRPRDRRRFDLMMKDLAVNAVLMTVRVADSMMMTVRVAVLMTTNRVNAVSMTMTDHAAVLTTMTVQGVVSMTTVRVVAAASTTVPATVAVSICGICSRREADDLIKAGCVMVNDEVITTMGYKVKTEDKVVYGGQTLNREKLRYILLNKPKGYITTSDDPYERDTVMELVKNACPERVYPVGRLDKQTTGLLLFTNDGDLAKKLTHPSSEVPKLYHVILDKPLTKNDMLRISEGIELDDGPIAADSIAYDQDDDSKKSIGIELHSGRNRIVRRIFEHLGYEVTKLDRVMFAGLDKYKLPRGEWRFLTDLEVVNLKKI